VPDLSRRPSALLETVRVRQGLAPLWSLHEERVRRSAAALGYSLPESIAAPSGGADRICRIEFLSRARTRVTERQVESPAGLRLRTAAVPHRGYRHKTSDREWLDAARLDATMHGADDVLFLGVDGSVAESSIWSVFWWEGGRLAAPSLETGILPGVARARLAELVGGIVEAALPGHLLTVRGGFLANAARGVVPISELDGLQVVPDPATAGLQEGFWP